MTRSWAKCGAQLSGIEHVMGKMLLERCCRMKYQTFPSTVSDAVDGALAMAIGQMPWSEASSMIYG